MSLVCGYSFLASEVISDTVTCTCSCVVGMRDEPSLKNELFRASPVAEWLSSHALLRQPRVSLVQILGADLALLIKPCEVATHIAQPEGPATRVYNCVLRGFGGKKKMGNRC